MKDYIKRQLIISSLRILMVLVLTCYVFLLFAQHPWYITNYSKADYHAANQNWDIALDEAGNIFMANSSGLLVLSGGSFKLVELPGKSIMRSVACVSGKVYSGSFEEFGYWEHDEKDGWIYHSLVGLLKDEHLENDEIWKITPFQEKIYFQSFGKILCYKDNEINSIPLPGSVLFIMEAGNRLFVQQIQGGLYELTDDELHYIQGSNYFSDTEVRSILSFDDGGFLIATSSKGLYKWDGSDFNKWDTETSRLFAGSKINNGIKLNDWFVFGSILNGVYIIDKEGNLIYNIHTGNGLQNNTVLALKSDHSGNLWIGLDKGIDYVAFDTPMHFYTIDEEGSGAVYTAALFKNHLYIGTNQGVFYYSPTGQGMFVNKRFVEGSQGQAWFLKEIDGHLYCGLNHGTFMIDNNRIEQVGFVDGGYNLKKISLHNQDYLIQSTYNSVVLYNKQDEIWKQHHIIHGFNAPARLLELDHIGNIWLGHTISGLYMLQPNSTYDSAVRVTRITTDYEPSANLNKVFKVDNRVVVATGNQLLQWDAIKNELVPYSEITSQLEGFDAASNIIPIPGNKYWFIGKNEIALFEIRFGRADLLYRIIPKMFGLEMVEDYENIVALNDSLHLICLENGFTILNVYLLEQLPDDITPPVISRIELWKNPDKILSVPVSSLKKAELKHVMNNVNFYVTTKGEAGKKQHFQYRLKGIDETWSDWSQSNTITYTRLPYGSYTFQVRTLSNKGMLTQPAEFRLRIKPPFHFAWYAYALYVILFLLLLVLIRIYYLRRKWKQKILVMKQEQDEIKRLKESAEKEVIRLINEKLQSEISHVNIQLANNTMVLIRKNELLSEIQHELIRQKEELGQRLPAKYFNRLNKMLEQGISDDHDWELFEKLFDQAHENFFQRLKTDFPDLTTSDLRLCAYLRLNLSSKEISPLLNITVRGVEERRYRLRKRLQLTSEQNLTEFILSY